MLTVAPVAQIFRLFKWVRETYKIRRGLHRCEMGIAAGGTYFCTDAICGFLDSWGHAFSLIYFMLDNLLWGISVGMWRSKEVPKWQRESRVPKYWDGNRRNGLLVDKLGGITSIKYYKNLFSLLRTVVALVANVLLLRKALRTKWRAVELQMASTNHTSESFSAPQPLQQQSRSPPQQRSSEPDQQQASVSGRSPETDQVLSASPPPQPSRSLLAKIKRTFTLKSVDDPLLFHIFEVVCIVCNLRMLLAKLKAPMLAKLSHTTMGALGMVAATIGMWVNWRKVVKKKCGAKQFEVLDKTPELIGSSGFFETQEDGHKYSSMFPITQARPTSPFRLGK